MAEVMVVDVICERCQKAMYIPKDFEPTGLCHDCAYETVDDLRAFIRELFTVSEWPDGGDIDLGDFQALAIKHGLLVPERRTAPCGEICWCEEYHGLKTMVEGVTCYRKAEWLNAADKKSQS